MRFIPFLIAAFLLINPLLELVFRKLEIEPEKLQFWVMLTSGTAWLTALAYFILDPSSISQPTSSEEFELLPQLIFSLDWISGALVLSAVGLIFNIALTRQKNPQANAWLAGIGGACVIGLESNSIYTLGLTWTIIESFHFYFSYRDQQVVSNPRKYLPIVLLRLSAPAVMVLYSLTLNEAGGFGYLTDLGPQSGLVLIAAGLLGFLGWFFPYQGKGIERSAYYPGAVENWIPGLMGMMLILRGGGLIEVGSNLSWIALILSGVLFVTVIFGLLMDRIASLWYFYCGLLVATSAIIFGMEGALSWGVVMMLPGTRLWLGIQKPKTYLIPLILALSGFLPFPFLPSWAGVPIFGAGIPGLILGVGYGILLGSIVLKMLQNWSSSRPEPESFPLLGIIGGAAILISQGAIAFRLDWINVSMDLLDKPIAIWAGIFGMLPILILGNYLPLKKRMLFSDAGSRIAAQTNTVLMAIFGFVDQLVNFFSRIFEGQAGLIWALLIALLLVTMITFRGG